VIKIVISIEEKKDDEEEIEISVKNYRDTDKSNSQKEKYVFDIIRQNIKKALDEIQLTALLNNGSIEFISSEEK
jgi:hypothetical protein